MMFLPSRYSVVTLFVYSSLLILGIGCNSNSKPRSSSPLVIETNTGDEIRAILNKRGINGELASVQDQGDHWLVSLVTMPNSSTTDAPVQLAAPAIYKVFKSGMVTNSSGKTL